MAKKTKDKTSVRGRAALTRRTRRSAVDDRATGRGPAPKPEIDPETVPVSPQVPLSGEDIGRPPSPFSDKPRNREKSDT